MYVRLILGVDLQQDVHRAKCFDKHHKMTKCCYAKQRYLFSQLYLIVLPLTISSTKTKSMAMCENYIQRVKIVINDNLIEQVTDFKYLGYRVSEYKSDLKTNCKQTTK